MSKAPVARCFGLIGFFLIMSPVLHADSPEDPDWAKALIDKDMQKISYKSVARGQDVSFRIPVTNVHADEVQITALSTSCGCLSWDENRLSPTGALTLPAAITIPPGQTKYINLRLDTIRHHGEKRGTHGIVTFFIPSRNIFGTTRIYAEGYIRSDVVLQPGSVNFGSVDPEKGAEQTLTVSYAGRNNWTLTSAKFNSPHLVAEIVEKSRANGNVNYDLIVKLKPTAPIGALRDQMMLVTDDVNNPQIPVQVEARIEPEIVVTEANFGTLTPGKPKEIQVLVRSTKTPAKPFKIEKCERTEQDTSIRVKKTDETKVLHQITLTFTPPNKPGLFEETFFLTISGREEPITFKAKGRILDMQ
ncbi:hypothetical protein [Schlesneria sp.]|uniref:hypothetical protein n=1 Tax=Schlesneria sp. TaxID=2762018 RepID=UPI002EDC121F